MKPVKKAVRLPVDNKRAIAIACPEAGKAIAEANLPKIRKTCPNQAKEAARLQVDNTPTGLTNRPTLGKEADATAILIAINLTRDAMTVG
ncbi:hypothetical protein PMI35_01145 [Pseudomonas sp. GM78]|nr:hypothetical protein PMI35_01145 [Pseudomonas sp. GM78]